VKAGAGRRFWSAPRGSQSDVLASVVAGLVLGLFAACVVLTFLTRDLPATFSGAGPVLGLASAGLGVVIVRRQSRNPIGWLLAGCGVLAVLAGAADLYAVLDFRIHHGALPGGRVVVFAEAGDFLIAVLYGLAILLFPTARCPRAAGGGSCGCIWLPALWSPRSRAACRTRWIWMRSARTWPLSCTGRWNPPTSVWIGHRD
jgi:hypothetical protein